MQQVQKKKKARIRRLHNYYQYTGFYDFVWQSLKKAFLPIIAIVIALVVIDYFVHFKELFEKMTETFSPFSILTVFFISESILGLIPPEIFIAWSAKMGDPVAYLSLLALLSYLGGVTSYFIGLAIYNIPKVHAYFDTKLASHIKNTRKWGGFLIIVGALLPIPFSMTCMAAGLIRYKFTNLLLFGLLRFVRFYIYALAIYELVE
ncbi:MAG: short-chain dehydrogenase [Crocinitomicaceae bacterium]|nr:short-chain dehydrogenase [Crocinitomicaceae bacterium]